MPGEVLEHEVAAEALISDGLLGRRMEVGVDAIAFSLRSEEDVQVEQSKIETHCLVASVTLSKVGKAHMQFR